MPDFVYGEVSFVEGVVGGEFFEEFEGRGKEGGESRLMHNCIIIFSRRTAPLLPHLPSSPTTGTSKNPEP
ncbi:hypothetical protein MSMTP_1358 [Methanosarcina sp. MTP4]|uniref:hypothetical protein n=1 Tax=Methanosarcina sp. MTP4 TaxID=1434100 RepID=UPI000615B7BC|nr:hypothetical protein [Methanosarcina sp. MTP4]AKB24827.1 hypothetical protein MSMTP_1358 [Methanosarcina sp. MTP4]